MNERGYLLQPNYCFLLSAGLNELFKPSRREDRRELHDQCPQVGDSTDQQKWCSRPGQYTSLRTNLILMRNENHQVALIKQFYQFPTENSESSRSSQRHQSSNNSTQSEGSCSRPASSSRSPQASNQGSSGGQ